MKSKNVILVFALSGGLLFNYSCKSNDAAPTTTSSTAAAVSMGSIAAGAYEPAKKSTKVTTAAAYDDTTTSNTYNYGNTSGVGTSSSYNNTAAGSNYSGTGYNYAYDNNANNNTAYNTYTAPATTTQTKKVLPSQWEMAPGETSNKIMYLKYHVITGSFADLQNARKQKQELLDNGFDAGIIVVDNQMNRVFAYSSNDETIARRNLAEIRSIFPDAWLYIQK